MNDFAKISKYLADDEPDFSACIGSVRSFDKSYRSFHLFNHHKPLKVEFRPSDRKLTISGNFGMYWQGQNFIFSDSDFRDSINHASEQLNVDLYSFNVDEFDQSAIVKVEDDPDNIIRHHISLKGHEVTIRKFGKYWNHPSHMVKLYNATKRMSQLYKKPVRDKISAELGVSQAGKLIRFEKKYKKPGKYFNRGMTLEELIRPGTIDLCNEDLILTYQNIMKTGKTTIPGNKKDINSSTLPLILLQELSEIHGFDTSEQIKKLIKSIPKDILNANDRKQRQRQITTNLRKIKSGECSPYDLIDKLTKELRPEG
ncbi:MAG: hypothetical protein U0Y08_05795 [Bacteroidia bacterium]